MSTIDLNAGRLWVERRFEEIAREFGAPRRLTREDRWREPRSPPERNQSMAYYIEIRGHLKRGEVAFSETDLEVAGTGEPLTRERLGQQIRTVLGSHPVARD
jgi:hypothetical protein